MLFEMKTPSATAAIEIGIVRHAKAHRMAPARICLGMLPRLTATAATRLAV